jgi:signal transduction histidine kinase
MTHPAVLVVGACPEILPVIRAAAALAEPDASLLECATLEEALAVESTQSQCIVMADPRAGEVDRATAAADPGGLPRWAIVVIGSHPAEEGIEVIPREGLDPNGLARAIRSAVAFHQQARLATRLSGDLLTVGRRVNHDLRTPLGAILSTVELLREILTEESPTTAALTQAILDSAEEMASLLDRISFVLKASAAPIAKERVHMGLAVLRARERLEERIMKKGARITEPSDWPEFKGVASWLEVIWWNLLANALEHGGAAPQIEAGWNREEGALRFWIRNQGEGVRGEVRDQLFYPFHRLHEPSATNRLGLSIVQRLVDLQGGTCGYQSDEHGATFHFTLPASTAGIAPASATKSAQVMAARG